MSAPRTFHDGRVLLHAGDCRAVLDTLAENSVDSCCTDAPYFLTSISDRFGAENAAPAQHGRDGSFSRLSGGFMGMKWDHPGSAVGLSVFEAWLAGFIAGEGCFRIQAHKEGKYYTASFSIHLRQDDSPVLIACRDRIGGRIVFDDERVNKQGIVSAPGVRWIVDARGDCLALAAILDKVPLFAKKADDYALWRRALHLWETTPKASRWSAPRDVTEMADLHDRLKLVKRWTGEVDLNFDPFMRPDQAFHYQWAKRVYRVLKPGAYLVAFSSSRTFGRMSVAIEDAGFITHPMIGWLFGSGFPKATRLTACALGGPFARIDVDGFRYGGQALKPALEPIYVGQKPFSEESGTANILRWGTGAINIDGCRVGSGGDRSSGGATGKRIDPNGGYSGAWGFAQDGVDRPTGGRWPANLIHDGSPEVLAGFPEAPGQQRSVGPEHGAKSSVNVFGDYGARDDFQPRNDSGSAARFFYQSKADADDRLGSRHPTVKPLDLMRWLVRLVTPPKGLCLDPFAGTGTTGHAALIEGMRAVLIEREPEYQADIARRMDLVFAGQDERARKLATPAPHESMPLFGGVA